MKIIEVKTKRGDSLFGCWYGEEFRDTCIVLTNGTGGNIFENKFLRVVGEEAEKQKISFIYAHNSGAFQIIDTPSKSGNRNGLTFELFDNCIEDLQAFVDFCKNAGYKKIVLGGHSYGANKVVYYLHKTKTKDVSRFVLVSPTDTGYLLPEERASEEKLLPIVNEYVAQGKENEILPNLFGGCNFYTAKAFLDFLYNPHNKNIPVYGDSKKFNQLKSIKIDGLFVMGQNDPFAKRNAKNHLKIMLENCKNSHFKTKVIENTSHTFKGKEQELANIIIDFVRNEEQK